jgi:hypothetical protein
MARIFKQKKRLTTKSKKELLAQARTLLQENIKLKKKNQELLANEKLLQEVLENNENLHDDIARLEYQIDQGFVRRLLRFFGF